MVLHIAVCIFFNYVVLVIQLTYFFLIYIFHSYLIHIPIHLPQTHHLCIEKKVSFVHLLQILHTHLHLYATKHYTLISPLSLLP